MMASSEDLLLINHGKHYATGRDLVEGFLVLAGSRCVHRSAYQDPRRREERKEHIDMGVLDGKYKFTRDYLFKSPTAAANVVLGQAASGPSIWKNSDGLTLKKLRKLREENEICDEGEIASITPLVQREQEEAEFQRKVLQAEIASSHDVRPNTYQNSKMTRRLAQIYSDGRWMVEMSPADAANNIKTARLREFGLRFPTWLKEFAEIVEMRRAFETPDAEPWNDGVGEAMLKVDAEPPVHRQKIISRSGLSPRDKKLYDWLCKQSEPQTTTVMAKAIGMSLTTIKKARRSLEAAGLVSGDGTLGYLAVITPRLEAL
jgi:Domain of unknown function (DUF4357)